MFQDNQSFRPKHALRRTHEHAEVEAAGAKVNPRADTWSSSHYQLGLAANEDEDFNHSGRGRMYAVDHHKIGSTPPVVMPYDPSGRPGDFGFDFEVGYEDANSSCTRSPLDVRLLVMLLSSLLLLLNFRFDAIIL